MNTTFESRKYEKIAEKRLVESNVGCFAEVFSAVGDEFSGEVVGDVEIFGDFPVAEA